MKKKFSINTIYSVILLIGIILCIAGSILAPSSVFDVYSQNTSTELTPTEYVRTAPMVREYHFTNVDWSSGANCLRFATNHQAITVIADQVLLFERDMVPSIFGHTTGCSWTLVDIPEGTEDVTVIFTACYSSVSDSNITFYQGNGTHMVQMMLKGSLLPNIISLLNIVLGIIMIIYWMVVHKRSSLNNALLYLGAFAVMLGIWSSLESDFVKLLFTNHAACSFTTFILLMMMCIPFIQFFRNYLHAEDEYLCTIISCISIAQIIFSLTLHFTGIADLKETLSLTHVVMLLAMIYLLVTIIAKIYKRQNLPQVRVSIIGMLILSASLLVDMFSYYVGAQDVDTFGRFGFFTFILLLGIDAAAASIRELEAGKKAALYKELAEKDQLTGCYNRNAYHNDTCLKEHPDGTILVTFDLNNLKYYNDNLGHACGDRYLTDSVLIMQRVFSPHGKLYRIGGDEFCVIIDSNKHCNIKKLQSALIEEERAYNAASDDIKLEIACGYAHFNAHKDASIEDTRKRADERMYENKRELKGKK